MNQKTQLNGYTNTYLPLHQNSDEPLATKLAGSVRCCEKELEHGCYYVTNIRVRLKFV